ncbi:MAG: xanthine dehydrogenase family protein molybdopterin-binding subunit [Desulfobacterales bacterium]|nr:MAG: xanthine dehydrogenase family protein molybdopterin-binding subunit [Desulfobacterales bacterium]
MKNKETARQSFPPTASSLKLSRREFLKRMGLLGGGVVVYVSVGDPSSWAQPPTDFNAFLRIGADGRVICFSGKIEMGQGVVTSLAQMLADELGVPLTSVDMVLGDTLLCPYDRGTFGSLSTKYFGATLRQAAAEARAVLIQMAAARFAVAPERLSVRDGQIIDSQNTNRKVTYAQLTRGKRIERHLTHRVSPLPASRHTVSGRATGRTDARQKVTGEARYAGDIRLPDMLYAKILRPPAHGATLKSINLEDVGKVDGVKVIRDGDLIAVLHPYPDEAQKALDQVQAEWDLPDAKVDNRTIFEHLLHSGPSEEIAADSGDIAKGKKMAAQNFDSTYLNHYVAHAPMEPHTALAHVEGQKATVWASTQTPFGAREDVARTLGLASRDVRVITPFVGGGFGGKTRNQQVIEAARLATLAGKPVQVAWTRQEEFFYDTFRPAAAKFGHRFAKTPTGKGLGLACTDYKGTYVATMAEVEVDKKTGHVQVARVVCAHDLGEVINPEGARLQIEGGITMGLGYALREEIRFKGGRILDANFDTYELPRFSWLPQIETILVDNPAMAPQGCGEPAITTMGAVIANAVYDAVGVRLFELPMTPQRIKAALKL